MNHETLENYLTTENDFKKLKVVRYPKDEPVHLNVNNFAFYNL